MKKTILIGLVALFGILNAGEIKLIDKNATDPAYILPLKKYPKWLCEATLKNGKKIQFVSVKAMMQVFYHQDYFKRHKFIDSDIKEIFVQDYLNGHKVNAKKAFYLFGSKIVGPHGDDLIPFETLQNAELFKMKNGGTKIMPYQKLSIGLIRYLDM